MANDGVLIVKDTQRFQPLRERIVVPRPTVDGLLTTLHIRFSHPSRTQIKRILNRFALDFDKASEVTSVTCHQCQAVKSITVYLRPQSSTQAPTVVGASFAVDAIRRYREYRAYHRSLRDFVFIHSVITYWRWTTRPAMQCSPLNVCWATIARRQSNHSQRRPCTRILCTGERLRLSRAWHPLKPSTKTQ